MNRFLLWPVLCASLCLAQAPEVSTQEEAVVFKSKVTLILVPVVVRDKAGKAVGTLHQDDFQLFDKSKPQIITKFSVEKPDGKTISRAPEMVPASGAPAAVAPGVLAPDHFVGLLIDDIHLKPEEIVYTRTAAQKFFDSNLKAGDRAAIFTTSGQTTLNFTDDHELWNQTLLKLRARPAGLDASPTPECPDISLYQADLILNKRDTEALNVATMEVVKCTGMPATVAAGIARAKAQEVLQLGMQNTRVAVASLRDTVHRMAAMPGQRTLILASPGFLLINDQFQDVGTITDTAVQAGVTISSLDARGLFSTGPDATKNPSIGAQSFLRMAAIAQSDVLGTLADGTGGTFIHNTNDLGHGLEVLGSPEVYYVLGFSPQNLKTDGTFHALKVSLKAGAGLTLTARRGYYAPTHLATAAEDAKEQISQALFSRDEIHDIPVDMHTQFFKASETEARLAVISRLDVRKLRFSKAEGRNVDDVAIVTALFDRNGNYEQSISKIVHLRLLDDSLQNKLNSGISVRSDFKVAPGTYVIRLVVRDTEGQTMATQDGAVEIP